MIKFQSLLCLLSLLLIIPILFLLSSGKTNALPVFKRLIKIIKILVKMAEGDTVTIKGDQVRIPKSWATIHLMDLGNKKVAFLNCQNLKEHMNNIIYCLKYP